MKILVSINRGETKPPFAFARKTSKLTVHHRCIHSVNGAMQQSVWKKYNQGTVGMTWVIIHTYIHDLTLLSESVLTNTPLA